MLGGEAEVGAGGYGDVVVGSALGVEEIGDGETGIEAAPTALPVGRVCGGKVCGGNVCAAVG